jgi:hypothetical protein
MSRPRTNLPSHGDVKPSDPQTERAARVSRSHPARYPPHGAWPAEMRADMAAAFLDYATTGELTKAITRGEAPRPTDTRLVKGCREPMWAREGLASHVANRHEITSDVSPTKRESIGDLI